MDKEVKVKIKNCLNCGMLFECPDILGYSCKRYIPTELNMSETSERYLEAVGKLNDIVVELRQAGLELQIAGKVKTLLIDKHETTEKSAISKRNKEIIALVNQGQTIEEIAKALKLEEGTVRKEIEYLTKTGHIQTITASNILSGKKAELQVENGKVVVNKTAA